MRQRDREMREKFVELSCAAAAKRLQAQLIIQPTILKIAKQFCCEQSEHTCCLPQSSILIMSFRQAIGGNLSLPHLPQSSSFILILLVIQAIGDQCTFTQFQSCQSCEKFHQIYVSPHTVAQLKPQQPPKTPPANQIKSIKSNQIKSIKSN